MQVIIKHKLKVVRENVFSERRELITEGANCAKGRHVSLKNNYSKPSSMYATMNTGDEYNRGDSAKYEMNSKIAAG